MSSAANNQTNSAAPIPSDALSESERANLQRYLPASLAESLAQTPDAPEPRLLSHCITHLSSLLEATTSHLPALLVDQIGLDPIPGQLDGRFISGTLLFADISGFTAMSEKLSRIGRAGAEEVTAVVNEYFDMMLDILRSHQGQLIRFGGDALLGLFPEPAAEEESSPIAGLFATAAPTGSATLAAQAAQAMQQAMDQFAHTETSQGVFPLQMSVGLHTGRFFLAQLGDPQQMFYTLFGKDVNETAVTESIATAGQILLSTATYEGIDAYVLCTAVPHPEYPSYYLLEKIDPAQETWREADMATHYPLPPDPSTIRRLMRLLDAYTPYLPTGLLPRLNSDPRAPSLKGEHRLVATLFANVIGLGAIVDTLGPGYEADIVQALNQYFLMMSEALQPFGGVINKTDLSTKGDKMLVTFGAPIAHEDDPERAVRAALAMQQAMQSLQPADDTNSLPIAATQRIGISFGYVFAGYVGASWRHEYTVMGDEVNLAARLMSAAETGQIIVSTNVHRHVQTIADLTPRGAVNLKGKSEPVAIHEVTGLHDSPQQKAESQGLHAPLIGRDGQQQALHQVITGLAQGNGRIILLHGEAGVGKSRLVADVQATATEAQPLRWVTARCLSYAESVSYAPFRDMLRRLLGVTDSSQHGRSAIDVLKTACMQWLSSTEMDDTLPYLANFLNLSLPPALHERIRYLDGEALQQRIYLSLRALLSAISRTTPLVIQFDDMHWMDRASLDLLSYLLITAEELPLIWMLVFRPDRNKGCWQLRETAVANYPALTHDIALDRLSTKETETLLHQLLPAAAWPPGVANLILSRTEGNPLYLEEVLRSLMNDQILQAGADGQWRFSSAVKTITVPDTLEGVLLARLDRLEELCRWTVQVAAIIGRSFPLDVLNHATAQNPDQPLETYLAELQIVEMIREAQRNPERVYSFIHSLMQEVCYSSLAMSTRREYHQIIAAYLEDSRDNGWGDVETLPSLIARHAYAGGDWERALRYLLITGRQAQQLYANLEAVDQFQKALHAAEQLPSAATQHERLHIHLALGQLFIITGRYDEAAAHLTEAMHMAAQTENETAAIAVCRSQVRMHELRGEYDEAQQWIERGLAYPQQTADTAHILLLAGLINIRQGNHDAALAHCETVLPLAERLEAVTARARANNLMGVAYLNIDSNRSIEHFLTAFTLYRQAGDIQGEATSHNLIANAYFNLGRWQEAEDHYRQAYNSFNQIGDVYNRAMADNNLGGIALNRGQLREAVRRYQEGLELLQQIDGSPWLIGVFHMNLGATYVRRREAEPARKHLRQSAQLFAQAQSRDFLPEMHRHLAAAALVAGDLDEAETQAKQALSLAQSQQMLGEAGSSLRVLAEIALARYDWEAATENVQHSIDALTAVADEYELARSRMLLGRLLALRGKPAAARMLLDKAAETFAQLEATADLAAIKELKQIIAAP